MTSDTGSARHRRRSTGAATRTLLVPLDGTDDSERAVPIARRLAPAIDADVVVVAAELPTSPTAPTQTWIDEMAAQIRPREARTAIVSSLDVADALTAVAGDELDPLVCMATHARAPMGYVWFGSVAESVLRELPYPIVLVGPRCDSRWEPRGPIVACLDGSSAALETLEYAVELDRTLRVGITLVHVAHPLDTDLVPDTVLEAATKRFPGTEFQESVLRSREPEWEIVDHARRVDASVVACSTHGRTGLQRVLIGSVAMGVVRRAACPVLVRRAANLVGPTSGGVPRQGVTS